jgi:hypothetical protein
MLDPATARHSLGEMLGLGHVTAREIYATSDLMAQSRASSKITPGGI